MATKDIAVKAMDSLKDLLEKNKTNIAAILPAHLTPDKLLKLATYAAVRNPKILECNKQSVLNCVMQCAELGLEPNTPLQHAYIIPYKTNATVQIGYQGLVELVRRSGRVTSLFAAAVCENDKFEVNLGTDNGIIHKPDFTKPRGKAVCYYAAARLADGTSQFEVMTVTDIEKIRARSQAKNDGPWVTDFDEMAKKTVVKRLCKMLPKSTEFARAVEIDNETEYGELNITPEIIEEPVLNVPDWHKAPPDNAGATNKPEAEQSAAPVEKAQETQKNAPESKTAQPSNRLIAMLDAFGQHGITEMEITMELKKSLESLTDADYDELREDIKKMNGGITPERWKR